MYIYNETLDGNMDLDEPSMCVMKRSGERVPFDRVKIAEAIERANREEGIFSERLTENQINDITRGIEKDARNAGRDLSVEEIQDKVEDALMCVGRPKVARLYITYRYKHNEMRKMSNVDQKIAGVVERDNEEVRQENSNKNPTVLSVQRDYMAGEWSRYYTNRYLLPEDIVEAHKEGIIHFHDADYFAQHMHNCCLVNLEDMLQNGTCISGTHIDKPKSFATACTVASQIVAQVASSQYGGQTITMSHLAPICGREPEEDPAGSSAELAGGGRASRSEVRRACREGGPQGGRIRLPDDSVPADHAAVHQRTGALRDGLHVPRHEVPEGQSGRSRAGHRGHAAPAHPRRQGQGGGLHHPGVPEADLRPPGGQHPRRTPYFYLTKLAAECTAKRMVPDYISAKKMRELKGDVYPCMGCRSFLTPDRFTDAGVGNHCQRGELCPGKAQVLRPLQSGRRNAEPGRYRLLLGEGREQVLDDHERASGSLPQGAPDPPRPPEGNAFDVAPILWQDGALARLEPGETIDKLLYHGYSTISLGYAGLAECVYYMKGVSHTTDEGKDFGLRVMQALNDACAKWKKEEDIDYSVYGTPLESTTYKFAKCLQKRFGRIPGVTDKNYITNSYHIHVTEKIDAFSKLTKEAEFQKLSPGGAISYVEVPNMQNNIPAVIRVMQHIYDTILYAELNTKSDYCDVCGYDGEIQIKKDETGMLVWECPQCGNRDQTKMHVARRTCGYIGTQYWNQGRTSEIADRVLHL